jgi:geranylgeranyl diphosphate synthase type II
LFAGEFVIHKESSSSLDRHSADAITTAATFSDLRAFWDGLAGLRQAVDQRLDAWLPTRSEPPERLHEAMRYSVFAGGKRVRPILTILGCRAAGGDDELAMPAACGLECIHTYSLIHDDLPAMDDDDVRRGRPSNHRAFDEATAVLAGDALLTVAFEIIAGRTSDAVVAASTTAELARAAGWAGMVGGQMADRLAEDREPDAEMLEFIHPRKTGALIRAAVRCGAIAGGADDAQLEALTRYAEAVGLAFQIADDVLDETATSEQLGKTAGKDKAAHKLTFPAVYGLDESRARARQLAVDAADAVAPFGESGVPLARLARFVVARTS